MAKRVFVVFLALLTLTSVYSITRANVPVAKAAAPTTLNFQARLLNSSGSLVNDGTYNVEFKIYNASSSAGSSQGTCAGDANCLWTETRTGANKIQVKNGYLSAYLGDISALPTNIWNQQLYLTMNIGGSGAASWDGEMTPRIRLTSVPYAFRATIAESAETLSKNTGTNTGTVEFGNMTADRKFLFPDTSLATTASPGTICVYNGAASNCPAASGSAYYLQNDTVLQTQTNFHIQARDSGANGTIGGVISGAANGQTVDLLQFRASNDSTVLAAVTAAGNLQVAASVDTRAAGMLSIGTSTATAVTLGKAGVTTTNAGALTVTELGTFNGGLTSASNFTVTNAGNVAFQRNTTNYTGTGTQDDINFGTGALFRITSASALTITSIAGGVDGRVITLANASSNAVTINNNAGGTAANRIITGTGANLSVPAGATVQLAYDDADSRWRVIGGTATSGGGANQQLSNLSGTVAINTHLNPDTDNILDLGSSSYSWRTLYADTSVLTPRVDTNSATTLLLGTTTATAITLGRSGITTTNQGALTVSELLTANAGITASGGALSLTGNAASSLTTSSGALTITSAEAATWSTAAGNLTVDSAATLNLGTTNATAVSISKTGVTTTVNGALTVTQAGQFNGGLTVASDFTVTNAGNVAFQRNTTDITTTGTLNDLNLGTGVMFRLNGASTQTVTSIAGGTDGRIITIINAAAQQALFNNDSCSGCTASNRIVTGTNGALALPPGGSILLGYDTSASRWRIIGGTAVSGGGANRQLNNLQGTIAVNASLTTGADNTIDLGSNSFSWRTLYADTSVLTPTVDTDSAVALNIGTTNATNITIGHNAGTFAVDGTNFDLATNGVMTLAGGQTADITTQANQNLTVVANGTGTIVLNDTVTVAGTQTFSGVTTDITTGTNEDLTIDANGTGLLQLSDSVVVAAQQTIRFVGGTTAQRPASPSEGMMYFDTDTDKLLIYSNGKWQGDRRDVTKTVAPSNAAQEIKDSADYVATGTSDQTIINTALTAAAGGRVYLFEGTFTTDDAISVPNNTVLAGSGAGTLIQFANIAGQTQSMIINSDTTTGTGVTVRDLKLDGNDGVNTTGSQTGIFFNGLGGYGTERRGALIQGVTTQNFLTQGIRLENSVQSIVTGSTANNNGGSGMFLQSSSHNTVTGNTASGNGVNGIGLNASSNNTITANTTSNNTQSGLSVASSSNHNAIDGNTSYANGGIGISLTTSSSHNTVSTNTSNANGSNGISLNAAHNNSLVGNTSSNNTLNGIGLTSANQNTLTGDTTSGNGTNGISLSGSSRNTITGSSISSNLAGGTQLVSTSDDNVISSGVLYDNGGSGAVSSITVTSSSNNQIIGNRITDTAGTAYAINISNAGANTNYLAANTFSGTGATTINDAGTGTIYGGQIKDSTNGNYYIQPAGTVELMKNTNVTGTLTASVAVQAPVFDTASAVSLAIGNTNATAITLGRSGITTTNAGALTVTQLLTANAGITASGGALSLTGNAASSLTTSSGALTITSAAAATWSTATGNLTVDSAAALQLGTGTATSLSVSRTGVTTTVNGALTVTQAGTFNGGLSVASDFTVTNAGNVAFQRNTTDFTTTGTSNDVNLGTGVLFRLNGATAQTITSIAGGTDGRIITLVNAAANAATIQNNSGGTAANRIITGTGGDLSVPSGASIQLAYDSSASRWRVIGGSAVAGGGANQQLSNLSGTVAVNASLTPNADNTLSLGSAANSWATLYADTSVITPTVDTSSATTLNLGTTTASAISISRTGVTTTVNGALTVTQAGTFNGSLTSAGNFTVTNAGNVAFQRNTTDFTATGTSNDVNLGSGVMFRLNGASAQTITSITGGTDGRVITLINAGANTAFIENDTGGTAANRIVTGTGGTLPIASGASIQLGYDSAASRWRVIGGSATAGGGANQQLSNLSGTVAVNLGLVAGTDNAIDLGSSSFGWRSLYADTSVLTPSLDTATATALNIGTSTATSIVIGQTGAQTIRVGQNGGTLQLDGTNFDLSTAGVITLAGGQTSDITTAAASTASGITIKPGNSTGTNVAGPILTLQGGAATAGNANGGAVTIAGGAGFGTGTQGLVNLSTTAFSTSLIQTFSSAGVQSFNNPDNSIINNFSTIPVTASTTGVIVSIPDPAQNTIGRIVYIAARSGSSDFTIRMNASRTPIDIAMKANSTATLIWNGTDWTAAGASSSTDLQSAYNNTLTSAGGAEIILNASGGAADGFTIRNNGTTPISGGLLEVQSSIGTNLFSVNNYATEFATNGGAETAGASSTTFPANTWSSAPAGGTVTREHVTTGFIATGQASVKVATGAATDRGTKNTLTQALISGRTYQVSFTAKLSVPAASMSTLVVVYSDNGTTATSATCATGQSINGDTWSKVTCTFVAAGTITSSNAVVIRQSDATARTFYIDNLSVTEISSTTTPSNVQVGGGLLGGQPTLFTLDRFSSAPVSGLNSTYYGSMYYDTTTNRIQCYEADGWGACGSAPDNIITLTPEYTGAVLNGSGIGVMTADICANQPTILVVGTLCASGEARNFYRWTSPQATLQDYSIYVSYKLPTTFKEFADNNTMKLTAYRDDADDADALVKMATYRKNSAGGLTLCGSETNITQSSISWEQRSVTGSENSCSFTGGDYIIFKITMSSRNNTNVYVENLDFTYTNR